MSALAASLSPAATEVYDAISSAGTDDQLTNLARAMWHGWGKGELTDDDAQFLGAAIEKRWPRGRRTAPGFGRPIGACAGRVESYFRPRRPQRSPDREASRNRRRMLAGSSALPPNIRHHYTEGERAVLCIVSGEVKRQGVCDWPIDKIAATAGVSRSTVQNALREAQRLGHVMIQHRPVHRRKSLTNVVHVISREWRTWIARGPSMARSIGFKTVNPTRILDIRKEGAADKKAQDNGPWAATIKHGQLCRHVRGGRRGYG